MNVFDRLESEVRGYCRSFPAVFAQAQGSTLIDENGRRYLDFFAGAGVLNYGHNPRVLRDAAIEYLMQDGVVHTLDMWSVAKRRFLETFEETILRPRGYEYKIQFPGPTGTNAVEAALKLARKATGRTHLVYFSNAFHGMTLGALTVTRSGRRENVTVPSEFTDAMPYAGSMGDEDTLDHLESFLRVKQDQDDYPAAIILETIQAEGGVNVASSKWLRRIGEVAKDHGILLIVDDIQVGCGRTGPFFSFEEAGLVPDIVCLSKALSGFGFPMSLVLMRPDIDVWKPGEHTGTFRGHNPSFVTATAALREWWTTDDLRRETERKGAHAAARLKEIVERHPSLRGDVRGRGLIQAIASDVEGLPGKISAACFDRGLVAETCGEGSSVLKLLPPLTIEDEELDRGLDVIADAVASVVR